ncbi:tRNA (adenosine(37)-N6)-threonylcarbamoyltransferase complex ATPase subunit type 1 TsaE [Candidatus Gottesmanbacteria bacterium]|nr:tRNA (adenosine(37)-N6)-threonylcarbamoyltransferase complex ATPase subunit type 1 TsaE [Candidatus Gottesmanbacteria bacterium]
MRYITNNSDDTSKIGKKIAAGLKGGEVFCLYGELGAGKSVFTRALINYFLPGIRILSPTFIIVRQYNIAINKKKTIYHLDLYRLSKTTEFQDLGMTENFHHPDTIMVIEWADRIKNSLPPKRTDISFKILGDNQREIIVKKYE